MSVFPVLSGEKRSDISSAAVIMPVFLKISHRSEKREAM